MRIAIHGQFGSSRASGPGRSGGALWPKRRWPRPRLSWRLGGDGFMLQTLHETQSLDLPVYGMNCGTIGFLMNAYSVGWTCPTRLAAAVEEVINPLAMRATTADGTVHRGAGNQRGVSLLRAGPQAAKLRISVDGRVRLAELVCDGALVGDASRIDRLQLFRAWADPADRIGGAGADGDGGVSAAPLARGAVAEDRRRAV